MLKKLFYIGFLVLCSQAIHSQTIVGTTPENRKAILEEFTGINCQYCPDGHAIANTIKANNPDDFFVINVHVGGFANPGAGQPDFRTPFGTAINNQAGVVGYPAGTVNRQVFPGWSQNGTGGTAMNRNFWTAASNQIIDASSYVNLGVEALVDVNTRELTVLVEVYYTGDSPASTNKLNVALLQNNTLGPQSGGGMGNNYVHNHRLVHMLTGQWGVDVNTTTTGSFVTETFTYTIPTDYNGIPVDFFEAELEVVVFMAETQQTIISGNGAYATYTGLEHANDISLLQVDEVLDQCDDTFTPVITIQNLGSNTLTSLEIEYSINGENNTYNWTGNLTSLLRKRIELPAVQYIIQPSNTIVISLEDDDVNSNNEESIVFGEAEHFETNNVELEITFDAYPQETTWNIKDSNGNIVHSGGPYPAGQANNTVIMTLPLNLSDCYTFSIFDAFGDGICCAYGQGSYSLTSEDGQVIVEGGNFDGSEAVNFSAAVNLSLDTNTLGFIVLYPNPSTGILNVQTKTNIDIDVFDITGKLIHSAFNIKDGDQIHLSNLKSGLYLVKMFDEVSETTQKIIIK